MLEKNITKLWFVILIVILVSFNACEVDSTIPSYRYRQDNLNNKGDLSIESKYFVEISDIDIKWIFPEYPSFSEESQHLNITPNRNCHLDISIYREQIKNSIDYIIQEYYYYNYSYPKIEDQDCKNMINCELEQALNSADYFMNIQSKAIENNINIDISELVIYENIDTYTHNDNDVIVRVPCWFRLFVDTNDVESLVKYFPQLYPGNMNIINATFYFSINKDGILLNGWREVYANPLTVKWFTPDGINIQQKSHILLFEVENDRLAIYEGKEWLGEKHLEPDMNIKLINCLSSFAEALFSFDDANYWDRLYGYYAIQDEKITKSARENLLENYSAKLMGYKEEPSGLTSVYSDNQGEYYEVILHLAYEVYPRLQDNKSSYIEIENVRIPIGSYTATLKALVSIKNKELILNNWVLLSFKNKTKGLIMENH